MGSPLGPTYANTFMSFNEVNWLSECPQSFKPIMYKRYVDDTFLVFRENGHVQMFLDYLNSKHPKIKFTCELEQNNSLNFLDINLYKCDNHITTSIYRKPTYTGIGLNWFDGSPIHYKINSIKPLSHRAYNLTSSYINFHKEVEELLSYFKKNCYPPTMFYKILKQFLFKRYIEKPIRYNIPKEIIYIKVPFYGKISFNIRNKLQKLLNISF